MHSGATLCISEFWHDRRNQKISKTERKEPQTVKRLRQLSPQCEPSCCHAAVGKAHYDYASAARDLQRLLPHAALQSKHRSDITVNANGTEDSDTISRHTLVWPTIVLLRLPTLRLWWQSLHTETVWFTSKRHLKFRLLSLPKTVINSHPTANQCNSPQFRTIKTPTKRTQMQHNLVPPSSHTRHLMSLRVTQPLHLAHELRGRERESSSVTNASEAAVEAVTKSHCTKNRPSTPWASAILVINT